MNILGISPIKVLGKSSDNISKMCGSQMSTPIAPGSEIYYPIEGTDDGYWWGVSVAPNDDQLAIGNYSSNQQHSWAIFPNITIPKGATITEAYIKFTSWNTEVGENVNALIYGNDIDSPVYPATTLIANALDLTTNFVNWNNIEAWIDGNKYNTQDISSIIQELIERENYIVNNTLMIIFKDNLSDYNARRLPSSINYNSGTEKAELHVSWS